MNHIRLATAALGGLVTKGLLIALWAAATLIALFASLRIDAATIARLLKRLTGTALIGAGLLHAMLRASGDPVAWMVDAVLVATGAGLLWLARARTIAGEGELAAA